MGGRPHEFAAIWLNHRSRSTLNTLHEEIGWAGACPNSKLHRRHNVKTTAHGIYIGVGGQNSQIHAGHDGNLNECNNLAGRWGRRVAIPLNSRNKRLNILVCGREPVRPAKPHARPCWRGQIHACNAGNLNGVLQIYSQRWAGGGQNHTLDRAGEAKSTLATT
jgi:hypothetical protein